MISNVLIYLNDLIDRSFPDKGVLYAMLICVSPLFTGFVAALRAISGKKRGTISFFAILLLLTVGLFFIAGRDAYTERKYFVSISAAAVSAVLYFFMQTAIFLCFTLAAREKKPKKKYAARIAESPILCYEDLEKKAYPLKSGKNCEKKERVYPDYEGFLEYLQKIGDKPLSFSEREEYNKIKNKALFLSGVEINDRTTPDFRSLFMRSVKLAAKTESR